MANEEVLGPRKTMLVLVIVVGCFAVLWPRILSPLLMAPSREQLKPNQFDREAGCCEVLFDKDMAVLELINEVCNSAVHSNGKLTPYSAAECRKAVNDTCGLDLAAFLKRNENFGKTSKMLLEIMKNSNSSCLKENFGVHVWSLGVHQSQNAWLQPDSVKQERPAIRGAGPHPALRERGRAIPPGAPATTRTVVPMPPHARVRSSPLSVYYELDIKPPPIPGMRPPLGSPGGPVAAPKSSMGFVMPIYTICIIVFFVYTLSKILFKRTGSSPYETVTPDPQFRRRVFRDDSRTSPDKLVVTAISGLVAEVQQQMEASYAQNQQRQDVQQDNHTRPYTNGTVLHNSGPVHIVASEYREPVKEKSPEPQKEKESSPVPEESPEKKQTEETKQTSESEVIETKEAVPEQQKESTPEREPTPEPKEINTVKDKELERRESSPETVYISEFKKETTPGLEKEPSPEKQKEPTSDDEEEVEVSEKESSEEPEIVEKADELIKLDDAKLQKIDDIRKTEEFLKEETKDAEEKEKQSTPELLDEAIKDNNEDEGEEENASVKVVGMEVTAHVANGGAWKRSGADLSGAKLPLAKDPPPARHEAEQVQSIYLETEIPQQSRVLVADFAENTTDKPTQAKHSPMVVSGKMTLSLIQDPPRETPERDLESTVDSDFTTASGVTDNPENEDEDAESDNENAENLFAQHVEGDIIYKEGALAAIVSDGDSDVEEGEVIDLESEEEFEEEVEEEVEEESEEEEEVPTQQQAKK